MLGKVRFRVMSADILDCLVIGGGPAGLTAAIYLARFHLSVRVIDAGGGRATLIPTTHNHAGYPEGIAGAELVARMRAQAIKYGAEVVDGRVDALVLRDGAFVAGDVVARTVLLATGVTNKRPKMADEVHDDALARGLLRYCPICDGYEVTDRKVGVIGTRAHGMNETLFLRGFTRDITLISPDACHDLDGAQRAELAGLGIALVDGPCDALRIDGERMVVPTPEGPLAFDSVYPALGSVIHSELAVTLGAQTNAEGCLKVDAHQRTNVPGLYAAGDVVRGLDQISHAMGAASVAATAIRNDLAERAPIVR